MALIFTQHQLVRTPSYRTLLKEFVELYREQRCLWQMTHKDYFNRTKRYEAIDKLLMKYREFEPNAEHHDVRRKINTLRTTYRKEKTRLEEAAAAGKPASSALWCFELMSFVDDEQKLPRDYKENKGNKAQEEVREEIVIKEEWEEHNHEVPIEHIRKSPDHLDSDEEDSMPLSKRIKRERNYDDASHSLDDGSRRPKMEVTQFLEQAGHSIHPDSITEDRHDVFCGYLAHKLRKLPKVQQILAEKLINDVLFEAEWGSLTLNHKLAS